MNTFRLFFYDQSPELFLNQILYFMRLYMRVLHKQINLKIN